MTIHIRWHDVLIGMTLGMVAGFVMVLGLMFDKIAMER